MVVVGLSHTGEGGRGAGGKQFLQPLPYLDLGSASLHLLPPRPMPGCVSSHRRALKFHFIQYLLFLSPASENNFFSRL